MVSGSVVHSGKRTGLFWLVYVAWVFFPIFCIFVGFVSPQYVLTPKLEFLIPSSSTHSAKTDRLYGKGNSKSEVLVVALLKLIMAGKYK